MNPAELEIARISAEYERRDREIPADFYSWSKPANLMKDQQVQRACIRLLHEAGMFPLEGLRIADVGCGSGAWLLEFVKWGADPGMLAGIDLMPGRVEKARRRIPQADLRAGSAAQLPWPDHSFDLVSQFMLFMNLFDPSLRRAVAGEMLRVLKPGGAVLWFDIRVNNPRNRAIRGIRKREIQALFPECEVRLQPALLAPPLARFVAPRSWALAECLYGLPFLRTHYVGVMRKR